MSGDLADYTQIIRSQDSTTYDTAHKLECLTSIWNSKENCVVLNTKDLWVSGLGCTSYRLFDNFLLKMYMMFWSLQITKQHVSLLHLWGYHMPDMNSIAHTAHEQEIGFSESPGISEGSP